jgi:hypothetical protein
MTSLSPQAQAVLDASNLHPCKDSCLILAATLRTGADQFFTDWDGMCCAEHLKAIAAELEGNV